MRNDFCVGVNGVGAHGLVSQLNQYDIRIGAIAYVFSKLVFGVKYGVAISERRIADGGDRVGNRDARKVGATSNA